VDFFSAFRLHKTCTASTKPRCFFVNFRKTLTFKTIIIIAGHDCNPPLRCLPFRIYTNKVISDIVAFSLNGLVTAKVLTLLIFMLLYREINEMSRRKKAEAGTAGAGRSGA
jgi:hypothetical protein